MGDATIPVALVPLHTAPLVGTAASSGALIADHVVARANLVDAAAVVSFILLSWGWWQYRISRQREDRVPFLRIRKAYRVWLLAWILIGVAWVLRVNADKGDSADQFVHHDLYYLLSDFVSILFILFAYFIHRLADDHTKLKWRIPLTCALVVTVILAAGCWAAEKYQPELLAGRIHSEISLVLSVMAPLLVGLSLAFPRVRVLVLAISATYSVVQILGYVFIGSTPGASGPVAASALHLLGVSKICWAAIVSHQIHMIGPDGLPKGTPTTQLDLAHFLAVVYGILLHCLAVYCFAFNEGEELRFVLWFGLSIPSVIAVFYGANHIFSSDKHGRADAEGKEHPVVQPAAPADAALPSHGVVIGVGELAPLPPRMVEMRLSFENLKLACTGSKAKYLSLQIRTITARSSTDLGTYTVHRSNSKSVTIDGAKWIDFSAPADKAWRLDLDVQHARKLKPDGPATGHGDLSRTSITFKGVSEHEQRGERTIPGDGTEWQSLSFTWVLRPKTE